MTYSVLELTGCQDFLNKVPKILEAHPGWSLVNGTLATEVDYFLEQSSDDFSINGRFVLEKGAAVAFSDYARDHGTWGYYGFVFGASDVDHLGCKFLTAKTVTGYTVQDSYNTNALGSTSNMANNGAVTLTDWVLESSDDGIAWAVADTRSGITWADDEIKTFTVTGGGAHLFWRLRTTSAIIQGIRAIEFLDASGVITKTSPEYVFRFQGFGNFDDSYLGVMMNQHKSENEYSIRWDSFVSYDPANRNRDQFGTASTYLSLRDTPMQMHASVNERRLAAGLHLGGLDATLYVGHFLPYATPEEYPYPAFVAGSYDARISSGSALNATIVARSEGTRFRDYSGIWHEIGWGSSPNFARGSSSPNWQLEPNGENGWTDSTSWKFRQPVPNVYSMTPMVLIGNPTDWSGSIRSLFAVGEIEGFVWIPDDGVVSGTSFTDAEGDDFRVFQNYGYTAQADYCALRLN